MTDTTNELRAAKYRKKPVVIDAVQFTEAVRDAHLFDGAPLPDGVHRGSTTLHPPTRKVWSANFFIDTLEGRMAVELGDWIITGVKGEHYPCKPDIFAATYELATTQQPAPEQPNTPIAEVQDWPNDRTRRGIVPLVDLDGIPEGTKLYAAGRAEQPSASVEAAMQALLTAQANMAFGKGYPSARDQAKQNLLAVIDAALTDAYAQGRKDQAEDTTPPPVPAGALTDERIDAILDAPVNVAHLVSDARDRLRMFVRAIEREVLSQATGSPT